MNIQNDKDIYSKKTFVCNGYDGCLYKNSGRCIYNIAQIQQSTARACYEDLRKNEIEDEADYQEGLM